jgi:hypothetical protein
MKVDMEILDSWSGFAFQDLLIDVTAVVAATESDRTSNCHERSQWDASRKSPLEWQTRSTAGIT